MATRTPLHPTTTKASGAAKPRSPRRRRAAVKSSRKRERQVLLRQAIILTVVWLALTAGAPDALPAGLAAVGLGLFVSLRLPRSNAPLQLLQVVKMAPAFAIGSIAGGWDVAWRAFHPRKPIDPGWIVYRTRLPPAARVALGGELSLQPGTLAAGVSGGRLLVHCLDRSKAVVEQIRAEEKRIRTMIDGKGAGS